MKSKLLVALLISAFALSSCGSLPQVSLGNSGGKVAEEMELQELQAEPTEAVLPDNGAYFRDEFDGDISDDWGLKVVSGLESQLIWEQINGKLRLQTLPPNDTNFIFLNTKHTYDDVVITAEVSDAGPLDATMSLICRASEAGLVRIPHQSQRVLRTIALRSILAR